MKLTVTITCMKNRGVGLKKEKQHTFNRPHLNSSRVPQNQTSAAESEQLLTPHPSPLNKIADYDTHFYA